MFLSLDGIVYDYHGGYQDLQKKRVAFVGNADKRIKEDYLRILRYFRFYGRISHPESENMHEEPTMDAIRSNAEGLSRISGERIWSEWKKILAGPMGGPLTVKMIELGLAQHIGLPTNPDTESLLNIWKLKKNSLHYVTLLAHLLQDQDEMMQLHNRLRMSTYERDLGLFVVEHINDVVSRDLKHWQKKLLLSKIKHAKEYIEQVLMCEQNCEDLLQRFSSWQQPTFPVSGTDLKSYALHGKAIGFCLEQLKISWIDSDYTLGKEQLLQEQLPKAIETYNELPISSPKSKKRKKP